MKHKKRKNKKHRTRQERQIRIGRTYDNFLEYTSKNLHLNIVEMDTVEGKQSDSKCILTLFWRNSNFILMFLLENQTADEVTKVFEYLQQTLLEDDYKKLFQVILMDNGHEFFDVTNIDAIIKLGKFYQKYFIVICEHLGKKVVLKKMMNLLDMYYLRKLHLKILHKIIVIPSLIT